jgi:putative transposase
LMPDHVHMCISIPPKYAVAHVVGYLKGKREVDPIPDTVNQLL